MERLEAPYTKQGWDEAIGYIKHNAPLDRATFRRKARKLADAFVDKGLDAHRDADRLEGLSYFEHKVAEVDPTKYSRRAIEAEYKRWYGERYFRFVDFLLDRLVDKGLDQPARLRRQAATFLDVGEYLVERVHGHERVAKALRESPSGRLPSLTKAAIVSLMITTDVKPKEMSEQLRARGIYMNPKTLSVERWRRQTGK